MKKLLFAALLLAASLSAVAQKVDLTKNVTGVLPVANGGSGGGSCTAYAVVTGGTTSTAAFQCLASLGSSGYVLTSNGAGALPTWQVNPGAAGGSVTSVSVATANGFAGTVATATSTPAITLTTSVTGLLKGNGTAASAYAGTSCTNQFLTALDVNGAGTCTSPTLAGAQFANQGTATTLLHGNAAGNPSFAAVSLTADVTGITPIANGGTNASSASGTALDNITGFASTGFLTRTGAGTYAFQSATNGVTLGNLAQSAANTMLGNWTGSTANVSANAMPSCADTGGNHLNYVSGTGITCGTSGSGGGGAALSALTAATGANTIASGDNAQVWQWALTTAAKSAFKFSESAASTNGVAAQYLVDISTVASSTAAPFRVKTRANANDSILVANDGTVTISTPTTTTVKPINITGGNSTGGDVAGHINITGGNSDTTAGHVYIVGGNSTAAGSNAGGIRFFGGNATSGNAAGAPVEIASGNGSGNQDSGTVYISTGTISTGTAGIIRFQPGGSLVSSIGTNGYRNGTTLLIAAAAPTISSGFGSSPSISANNGATSFRVNVGTGGSASSGVIGLPTAATGWNCFASDVTTPGLNDTKQSATSTTSATLTNYNTTTGSAAAWSASDVLVVSCFAY